MRKAIVILDGEQGLARLRELGIDIAVLDDALRAWSVAEASATPFEPITAAGSKGWFAAVGVVREGHVQRGWRAQNIRNFPIVVRPDRKLALAVTSGDAITGVLLGTLQPKTKNPKGAIVEHAVNVNAAQIDLFEPADLENEKLRLARPTKAKKTPLTWFLLVHCTEGAIQAEVSLPEAFEKNRIVRWRERIRLPLLQRVEPPSVRRQDDDDEDSGDVVVPVSRK
jgi:hypothetical protein